MRYKAVLLLVLTAAGAAPKAAPPAAAASPAQAQISIANQPILTVGLPVVGDSTHLPLPRYASLKSSTVDLRVGPGYRYPRSWVLQNRGLPVKIIREYDVWRQIETADGTQGWVKSSGLSGKRDFVILGSGQELHRTTEADSGVVAQLQPGVIGHIESCAVGSDWCKVETGNVTGWILRGGIYGALPGEVLP